MTQLDTFRQSLSQQTLDDLRAGVIGQGVEIDTPYGRKPLIYADYVASGRALRQVEDFMSAEVLPFYANSHTEASHCGRFMTRLREAARDTIGDLVDASPDCSVVFAGSGATAGINRLVGLLSIADRVRAGSNVVVLIGPYEHHSNILPWRESGATVIEIDEHPAGGPDLGHLEAELHAQRQADLIVGSFSAASNVTGILTDPDPVTRMLKRAGALAIWDYAGGAPYLPMSMDAGDTAKDAIVFSPHKFPGGPGASGVLVVRDTVVRRDAPTAPGGGTVSFVSPWRHTYSTRVEVREEAGTPNVLGDIRAALVMLVKDRLGSDWILARDADLRQRALTAWSGHPNLRVLGQRPGTAALPIFSFQVTDADGAPVHHQLFTRMLSDHYGIQARGGCACAGPYAHRLLGLDRPASERLFARLRDGLELDKPGWVRLNLSYLHHEDEIDCILTAVADLAHSAAARAQDYAADPATARFRVA